jgi:hypothetical protein
MPAGAGTGLAGFEKYMVELMDDRVADQLANDGEDFGVKGQRAEEFALRGDGADLEVLGGFGMGLAVAVGGDVAEEAVAFEALEFPLHRGDFARVEEEGENDVAVGLELVELVGGELHGVFFLVRTVAIYAMNDFDQSMENKSWRR